MPKYAKASVHPSELREFQDDQTGSHIYQLTNDTSINHNLYFLVSSFTPDQEVEVMVNRGIICELIDMRTRLIVLKFT